jgi:sugar phosphate isomerase/epimerase
MAMVDEIKRAIEIAEEIPFRYLIQHVGVQGEEYEERKIDAVFTSLEELKVFAGQRGVEILLENTPNAFSSGARLNELLAITHLKLNYCFDIGHAHMRGNIAGEFEAMKNRIRSTHLHDNNGRDDLHQFPGKGSIDWQTAIRLLASGGNQYPLMLELKEEPAMEQPVQEARRVLNELAQHATPA